VAPGRAINAIATDSSVQPARCGDIPVIRFFWRFSPFWGGALLAAIFFFRYQVKITATTMTAGAFRRRVIPFSEVIDYDVIQGGRSPELCVYLKNGKKLKFLVLWRMRLL
jgi:hypothetical protein